jgi:hypothetical protein
MYFERMMGTKNLKPAIEKGTEAVRKADTALRLCLALAAATLVVTLCTLVAVLAGRPARA